MPDDFDKSIGEEATLAGKAKRRPASEVSLGDERTLGDNRSGQDTVFDDIEVVDLEARYRVEGTLGQGGMGAVLLATDTRLDRKVAIKRILGEAAGNRMAVQRFLTEAKAIAALNHPNVVQIHDYGRANDGPFLIMEYVDGGSLLDRCSQSALPLDEAIDLACQLCDGLAKAHDLGIIHRDIKPANVLLTKDGIPKLTDFGLAKAQASDHGQTMTGAVLGTPDFMPPEQRRDASLVDHRSDLWSLAATVYQMVTGRSPKVIRLHELPQALQSVIARALEDAKDARYQSARELRDALHTMRGAAGQRGGSATANDTLKEGQCPACGVQNDASRRFCRGCGVSVEAPCLKCNDAMPTWDDVCGKCGTRQSVVFHAWKEQLESDRVIAEACLDQFRFDDAEEVAERQSRLVHARFQDGAEWAKEFRNRIQDTRKRYLDLLCATLTDSARHEAVGDLGAAISCLEMLPAPLHTVVVVGHETVQAALERLRLKDTDNVRLEHFIEERRKAGMFVGLLPYVEQLIGNLPQRKDLLTLRDTVAQHEQWLIDQHKIALSQAKASLAAQEYDKAIASIARIDPALQNEDVIKLRTAAEQAKARIKELNRTLWPEPEDGSRSDDVASQLVLVEELLALAKHDARALKLRAALNATVQLRKQSAIAEAIVLLAEYKYSAAMRTLSSTPLWKTSTDIISLFKQAERWQARAEQLQRDVKAFLSASNFPSALRALERYLQLKPNDSKARELWERQSRQDREVNGFVSAADRSRKAGKWSELIRLFGNRPIEKHPAVDQAMNRAIFAATAALKQRAACRRVGWITQVVWSFLGIGTLGSWIFSYRSSIGISEFIGFAITVFLLIPFLDTDDDWILFLFWGIVLVVIGLLLIACFEPAFGVRGCAGFLIGAIPSIAAMCAWAIGTGFGRTDVRAQKLFVSQYASQRQTDLAETQRQDVSFAEGIDLSGGSLVRVQLCRNRDGTLETNVSELPAVAAVAQDDSQVVGTHASLAVAKDAGLKQVRGFLASLGVPYGRRTGWGFHGDANLCAGANGNTVFDLGGQQVAPDALIRRLLAEFALVPLDTVNQEDRRCLVACLPAYAGTLGNAAFRQVAGSVVQRILTTTHAEAFATYWQDRRAGTHERSEPQLVVHWSDANFEASVFSASDGCVVIAATAGDAKLAHDHFTQQFVDILRSMCDEPGGDTGARLWRVAEVAQHQLASGSDAWIKLSNQKQVSIKCCDYEEACASLTASLRAMLTQVVAEARLTPDAIWRVHLTGEHAQSPEMKKLVSDMFSHAATAIGDAPELMAAQGAALISAVLVDELKDYLLLPVWPHSIGIADEDGITERLFARNTTYPLDRKRIFEIPCSEQCTGAASLGLILVEGEELLAEQNDCIGAVTAYGAPGSSIEVNFDIDADGCINVRVLGAAVEAAPLEQRCFRLPLFEKTAWAAARPTSEYTDFLSR